MVYDFADICDVKFASESIVRSIKCDEVETDLHFAKEMQ